MENKPNDIPTDQRLIDVAGAIFAEKGRSATVREICSAAKCSVASINYYFGDKNRLYLMCVQAACERKQKLFPVPDAIPPDSGMSSEPEAAEVLLRQFLRAIASRMMAKSNLSWHNTLMLREVLAPSEGVAEMLREPFKRDFDRLLTIISALLGKQLDTESLRNEIATQVLARCMFLRTGENLRSIVGLSAESNEDPIQYADTVCDSILSQVNFLRLRIKLPALVWSADNNTAANDTPIEG